MVSATSTGIHVDHLHRWLGSSSLGRRVSATTQYTLVRRPTMGEKTDKISGRAKQAVGAVTGDEDTKRKGERQEDKGKLKGKLEEENRVSFSFGHRLGRLVAAVVATTG